MYHSLKFQDDTTSVNTWDDWHLIPSSRPTFASPTPILKYAEVPGRDGGIDVTDYLIGRPYFQDLKGSFEFYVMNGYGNWIDRKNVITNFFIGRKIKCFLADDDPDHYYIGRFYLKAWNSDPGYSKVIIEYQVDPFRYNLNGERVGL